MSEKPPPVLGNNRVLEYGVLDSDSGSADAEARLKALGPVPHLALVEDLSTGEIRLLHCDAEWDQVELGGTFDSILTAKARAERAYPGASSCWVDAKITREEALNLRDAMVANYRCSFCGRSPYDRIARIFEANNVRICNVCLAEFHKALAE
jgi:hypothetical protein